MDAQCVDVADILARIHRDDVGMRRAPGGADLFIAAITGWGQDEDRRRTESSGFDAHLVKPVPPEAVLNLVEQRRGE